MSIQNIYNQAMGFENLQNEIEKSVERLDLCESSVTAELAHAEEDLKFVELFGKVEDANAAAKIKMLNAINKRYGKCHRGIENYCRSCEADETTNSTETDAAKSEKKKKWYKIVWEKIYGFFQKIVNFFKTIIQKIIGLFKKKEIAQVENEINSAPSDKKAKLDESLNEATVEIPEGKGDCDVTEQSLKATQQKVNEMLTDFSKTMERIDRLNSKKSNGSKKNDPDYVKELKNIAIERDKLDKLYNKKSKELMKKVAKDEKRTKKIKEIFGTNKSSVIMERVKTAPAILKNISQKIEQTYAKAKKYGEKFYDSACDEVQDIYTKMLKSLSEMGSECSHMMSDVALQIQVSIGLIKDKVNTVIHGKSEPALNPQGIHLVK